MKFRVFLFLTSAIIILLNISALANQESVKNPTIEDEIVGTMFKALVKSYLATVDIEKFKKENTNQIKVLNEQEFRNHYARFFRLMENSPVLKAKFSLSPGMNKGQIISRINSWDKKKMAMMIDAIPNAVINQEFRLYLSREKLKLGEKNIFEQVDLVWKRFMNRFN